MGKVLHVASSPRGDRSKSSSIAKTFLNTYMALNPGDEVESINVFEEKLPAFDGPALQAKYNILHGQESSPHQQKAWQEIEAVIAKFASADKYVFSVPMWNFGIPYRLKQYFDVIVQPGYTFAVDPETGYKGLLEGRTATAIYARGGAYQGDFAAMDQQKPYMECILGFMGITVTQTVFGEQLLTPDPEAGEQALATAIDDAKQAAADF
jgi:FMN-dependent NADH-azoreductase